MSDRETGVEEARKVLGKLVDDAALDGTVTYLTRRGRRHAAIVPLDRIKETTVQLRIQGEDVTAYDEQTGSVFGAGRFAADTFICSQCGDMENTEAEFAAHLNEHR